MRKPYLDNLTLCPIELGRYAFVCIPSGNVRGRGFDCRVETWIV